MQLVIIEGIDKIGKTTFIKNLGDELKKEKCDVILDFHKTTWSPKLAVNYHPHSYEYANAFIWTYFLEVLELFKHKRDMVMILDRYHITSVVYGLIKREKLIIELYGTLERFEEVIKEFEYKLMEILGESRVHYIQFITDKIGIDDIHNTSDDLKLINSLYKERFNSHYIKSKHIFNLITNKNYQSNIGDHLPIVKEIICNQIEN